MSHENKSVRTGVHWSANEIAILVRAFQRGVETEEIAKRHLRKTTAIRSKLIDTGLLDPVLTDKAKSKHSGKYLIDEKALGILPQRIKKYPRDSFSWTDAEWTLCQESLREGLSIELVARIHRRSVFGIVGINYSSPEFNGIEGAPESEEEAFLRYLRLVEYGCEGVTGYRFVDDIIQEAIDAEEQNRFEEWLGPKYDDDNEDESCTPSPSVPLGSDGWGECGDDYDGEHWEQFLGGPDDKHFEATERAVRYGYESEPEYEFDEQTDDDKLCTEIEYIEDKYEDKELFFVQSAYPRTMLAAVAKKLPQGGVCLAQVAGGEETLPGEFKKIAYQNIADLKSALDLLRLKYPNY